MAKFYYNGVLLPEIPSDVLANYPYCWIRYDGANSKYNLIFSKTPWFYTGTNLSKGTSDNSPYYSIGFSEQESATTWGTATNSTLEFGLATNRTVLWSNHNIPNGSATSPNIYFYGSEPIDKLIKYYYNGVLLPELPYDALVMYPYACIRKNNDSGYYDLIFSKKQPFIHSNGNLGYEGETGECSWYQLPIANAESFGKWNFKQNTTTWWELSSTRIVMWSNCDIPNGSATSPNIYFYGSEPVPESGAEPDEPESAKFKYLIRSQNVLYTITDSVLTALEITTLTSDVFQTHGFDEIPDGSFLIGLWNPELLYWQESKEDELPILKATTNATPFPQTVVSPNYDMSHDTILGVECAYVTASSDVVFAISVDDGVTWYMWTGQAWGTLTDTATGMSAETINAITTEQWAELMTTGQFKVRMTLFDENSSFTSFVMDYIN